MLERESTKEAVITRYAELALISRDEDGCGCGGSCSCGAGGSMCLGPDDYSSRDLAGLPEGAVAASLGCGNPLAVASLREGETVLDLGSGGGIDVLLSAGRVGPGGYVYGLDITDEMLGLARENQRKAGVQN